MQTFTPNSFARWACTSLQIEPIRIRVDFNGDVQIPRRLQHFFHFDLKRLPPGEKAPGGVGEDVHLRMLYRRDDPIRHRNPIHIHERVHGNQHQIQ